MVCRGPAFALFGALALIPTTALAQEGTDAPPASEAPTEATEPPADATDDAASTDADSNGDDDNNAEATDAPATDAPATDAPATDATEATAAVDTASDAATNDEATEATDQASAATDGAAAAADAAAQEAAKKAMTLEEAQKVIAAHEAEEAAKKAAEEAERRKGLWWDKKLGIGASALGLFNRSFVGQADGFGLQLGAFATGQFVLGYKGNIWDSSFELNESLVATPNGQNLLAPILSKAADRFQAKTEYRFMWETFPYVGPFARAQVQAIVFPSWVNVQDGTTVVRNNLDGTSTTSFVGPNLPIATTGYFEPLVFQQSAGVVTEPPGWKEWVKSSFRLSGTAQEQFGLGGHIINDDPDTPELELSQVTTVYSAGVQGEAQVGGTILERVGYSLKGLLFYPVIAFGGGVEDVSLIERIHVDVEAKTSLRLAEWLSLDGVVLLRRQPFVLNDWQLQTSLLLTSSYTLF